MPRDEDGFWDELGVSWQASIRDTGLVSSRMKTRMKLQGALLTAGTIAAAAIGVLGFALAAWALWIGWMSHTWNFVTRAVTLAIVSLLALVASLALRARGRAETSSLRDMLQLSITQTGRMIRATDLTCYALVTLVVGGLLGYALRVKLGRPPAVSPVEDLLLVTLAGVALLWFRWGQAHTLKRFEHIMRVFDSGDEPQ